MIGNHTNSAPSPRQGRAAILIERILAAGQVTRETLSHVLNVTSETLDTYQTGRERIPLNHQARLALFVIASVPTFLKDGNRLRQQVAAAIAFETRQTTVHDAPPASLHRFPLSGVERDSPRMQRVQSDSGD